MFDSYIIKCGNCTPLGQRAGVSAASVRAGFSMISINPDFMDDSQEPIRMGLAEYLPDHIKIKEQFQKLATPALEEVLTLFSDNEIKVAEIPIFIGLPEDRPGLPSQLDQSLQKTLLQASAGLDITLNFEFILDGHTSCLKTLEEAKKRLQYYEFCIVGGVDSYNDRTTIKWLEKETKRLFCTTVNDGFIPGQAAGFVLLATKEAVDKYQLKPQAKILSVAFAEEENSFESGKNSTARALTQTIKQVLEVVPEEAKIDEIYSTQNGEKYSAQEYAYAVVNVGTRLKEVSNMIAPYTCWGDLGTASVPVLIGLMTEAGKKNYAKGPLNLITTANLGNKRASALIELLNLK